MGRKDWKKGSGYHGDTSTYNHSGGAHGKSRSGARGKSRNFSVDNELSSSQTSYPRNQVDPETTKYFTEIANVVEGLDLEERSVICGNALDEAKGKEVELATDYIISHTMQVLLEGCSVEHLCSFLQSSVKSFAHIAMDRSGSHVAETALKSLAMHLQDNENHSLIEETITALCEEIVTNSVDMMCNCYGSHVLRRILCLCKGVPVESSEFHGTKSSVVLAERFNLRKSHLDGHELQQDEPFPNQLKFLISEMLNPSRVDIATLQANQFSSLVLQTALKLLVGHEQELCHIIPIVLGCHKEDASDGNFVEVSKVKKVRHLVEENAYSHLMEVILAVAPDRLYNEICTKIFKDALFKMSSQPSANFVVQALISNARNQEHVKLIFAELGAKFKNLLEMGRAGVVAALLAASQRLQIHEDKCCLALADAARLDSESSGPIVPRILFIDNYFYSSDKANWSWPKDAKINVLGSLILQTVFKFPSEFIQEYITSIISLEDNHILVASKNPAGARVIEAFLSSSASTKQKRKLIFKLRGHFGELSVLPSGSFTVDKCFDASNLSLRETIVSELLPIQTEVSKTRQGPYLLKKFDVERFARQPDEWKSRQASKESAYKEFYEAFGSKESKSSGSENFLSENRNEAFGSKESKSFGSENFLSENRKKSQTEKEKLKDMRKDIETGLSSGAAPFLAHQGSIKAKKPGSKLVRDRRGFVNDAKDDDSIKRKNKRHKL